MDQLFIQPIGASELSRFESLLHDNPGMLFGHSSILGSASISQINAWQVLHDNKTVAVVAIVADNPGVGRLNLFVMPEARRQGVGSRSLAFVLNDPAIKKFRRLYVSVSASNTGAQKLLNKNGFVRKGHDATGDLEFEKRIF